MPTRQVLNYGSSTSFVDAVRDREVVRVKVGYPRELYWSLAWETALQAGDVIATVEYGTGASADREDVVLPRLGMSGFAVASSLVVRVSSKHAQPGTSRLIARAGLGVPRKFEENRDMLVGSQAILLPSKSFAVKFWQLDTAVTLSAIDVRPVVWGPGFGTPVFKWNKRPLSDFVTAPMSLPPSANGFLLDDPPIANFNHRIGFTIFRVM